MGIASVFVLVASVIVGFLIGVLALYRNVLSGGKVACIVVGSIALTLVLCEPLQVVPMGVAFVLTVRLFGP